MGLSDWILITQSLHALLTSVTILLGTSHKVHLVDLSNPIVQTVNEGAIESDRSRRKGLVSPACPLGTEQENGARLFPPRTAKPACGRQWVLLSRHTASPHSSQESVWTEVTTMPSLSASALGFPQASLKPHWSSRPNFSFHAMPRTPNWQFFSILQSFPLASVMGIN